jgi:thioredoxin-dependent peroxiredoxin
MAKKVQARPGSTSFALEGSKAPRFELHDSKGRSVKLENLIARKKIVLYFYPRDMTPGCTREACGFRDLAAEVHAAGAEVVGVSADSPESHQKFARKNQLEFTLLCDPDNRVAKAYGVYKKKSLYGREFMGIERTTFLIDQSGVIRKVFPKVKVEGHAEAVLEALKQMA